MTYSVSQTNPFNTCSELEAPATSHEQALYSSCPPEWIHGHQGEPRPVSPATDSGILTLLMAVFVLVGLNMRHVRRIFSSLPQDLLSVRRRNNAFDEHTANETRVIVLLLLGTCVMGGLLMLLWLENQSYIHAATSAQFFHVAIAMILLMAAYYIFQLVCCVVVGYAFTDKLSAELWRRGLNASTAILGISLTIPAMIALFYPALSYYMLILAALLYVLSRICYIYKGFRIFYDNYLSLFYFILYLCTLEIIPVVATCRLASEICDIVQ